MLSSVLLFFFNCCTSLCQLLVNQQVAQLAYKGRVRRAGEPFNNYDAVMSTIQIATHPMGLHFSKNKVTVSTVGLVPQIKRFCRSNVPAQLAVSLHATNDTVRNEIVPLNKTHSLTHLMAALRCVMPVLSHPFPLCVPEQRSTLGPNIRFCQICLADSQASGDRYDNQSVPKLSAAMVSCQYHLPGIKRGCGPASTQSVFRNRW